MIAAAGDEIQFLFEQENRMLRDKSRSL